MGLKCEDREGVAHDLPRLRDGSDFSERNRLDEALPIAVASTGPASTWRPVASAVNWLSSSLWLPPPTTCSRATLRPVNASVSVQRRPVEQREALQMQRVNWPGVSGAGWPVSRQNAAIFPGMSPGRRETGASGRTQRAERLGFAAACASARRSRMRALPCPVRGGLLEEP